MTWSNGKAMTTENMTAPLTSTVRTGRDNITQTVPFSVVRVYAGDKRGKWDVTKRALHVDYRISDVNSIAKYGRIVYLIKRKPGSRSSASGEETVLYTQSLRVDEIKPAVDHSTNHWNGTIREGLTDRIGKKVTADLSPIIVRVEIWDKSTVAPGKPIGGGKTDNPGEHISSKETAVTIDVIVEAKWGNHRCIPFGYPTSAHKGYRKKGQRFHDQILGKTKMKIRVNVAEGTPVRIAVCRIININDPAKDMEGLYTRTPTDAEKKAGEADIPDGLFGATVRDGGKVLLSDGSEPYVEWKHYEKHWNVEGENNFYCFHLAFGSGEYLPASERDYVNKESDCLHMRFTVLILCPWQVIPDNLLPYGHAEAKRLHKFFMEETKYFHSSIFDEGKPNASYNLENIIKILRNRYIVIFSGHAGCECHHREHPADKEVPGYGFGPDQDSCPHDNKLRRYYGCGHRSEIEHYLVLGLPDNELYIDVLQNSENEPGIHFYAGETMKGTFEDKDFPRLLFFAAGCNTMLTTKMAEEFTCYGPRPTHYFAGITYEAHETRRSNLVEKFFRRWIKGSKAEPSIKEYDVASIVKCFVRTAGKNPHKSEYPRITNSTLSLTPSGPYTINIGDRVQTISEVQVQISEERTGIQPKGATGTVIGDRKYANRSWWFPIDFDDGVKGWVKQVGLRTYLSSKYTL